jgi:hypothetical protein
LDNKIQYLNTDLDLSCPRDLTALASYFESQGMWIMHVTKSERKWLASFETGNLKEPESNIKKMLKVIEFLPPELRSLWDRCWLREFNIGYDCGQEPSIKAFLPS